MSLSPEQMRKKSLAEDESMQHLRYSQADGERSKPNTEPLNSYRIHAEEARVNAATHKEELSIGDKE